MNLKYSNTKEKIRLHSQLKHSLISFLGVWIRTQGEVKEENYNLEKRKSWGEKSPFIDTNLRGNLGNST